MRNISTAKSRSTAGEAAAIHREKSSLTERGERQREELLEVAIDLFAANGYAGTSIRDIAQRTGRSISNIYHYFRDKEALWLAILEHSIKGLPARLRSGIGSSEDSLERFRRLVLTHLHECARYQRESKIFFIEEERLSPAGKRINQRVQKEIHDIYIGELERMKRDRLIAGDNLRGLAFNVLGVINWHLRWLDRLSESAHEQMHEGILQFVLHGVCGAPPKSAKS